MDGVVRESREAIASRFSVFPPRFKALGECLRMTSLT